MVVLLMILVPLMPRGCTPFPLGAFSTSLSLLSVLEPPPGTWRECRVFKAAGSWICGMNGLLCRRRWRPRGGSHRRVDQFAFHR